VEDETSCEEGKWLDGKECKECSSSLNCKTCEDGDSCSSCEEGRWLDTNKCEECSSSLNCKTCEDGDSCLSCYDNYHLNSGNACVEDATSCEEGKWLDNKECKEYVEKCRSENKISIEKDDKFKIKQNDIFCKYEVPFNLMQLATDNMLDSKMDLEIALNNLVKRQKEKEEKEKEEKEKEEKEINTENNDKKPTMKTLDENIVKEIVADVDISKIEIKKRYFGIDLIRVLACFLVVLTHAGELYYIDPNGDLIRNKKKWFNRQ